MTFDPIVATVLILLILTIGELISIVTHARVPMLMTAMILYLLLIWSGLFPENMTEQTLIPSLGMVLIPALIVHMGTLMSYDILKKQWRAVVIALFGLVGAVVLVLTIGTLAFDFSVAASGIGPISGGVIALLITTERLQELGLTSLIVVPVMIAAFQTPVGMPITTYFMRKYSRYFLKHKTDAEKQQDLENKERYEHARFNILKNNLVLLTIIFGFGAVATVLAKYTPIHYTLYSLLFGIILVNLRILPKAALEKANSFSFLMAALMIVIINTMGGITPKDVVNHFPAVVVILAVGVIGLLFGGFIGSKLVGWHHTKGIPVALTALLGFPADYILCEEVSRSEASNDRDEEALFDELVSPMLIGGFVTVTIASAVIASFVMGLI
ncbi:hypothetical protein [Nosocomiicoccus sp. HMSC09A07]|uniref:hypothetical protein n=1 Tax=Nosocomiicoccus sp. HMSC09A07 TaxID=1581145 RepID=UPI0008A1563B|nr:hypothetical protein [Nosocomiicoccus sp. HMSC09A07]OFS63234.1 hypothetical protein HMPREF3177_03605 [Nosocomiicoccus sp. HMSC09A07]